MARGETINQRILEIISDNPLINQAKLSDTVGITRETCRKHLGSLIKSGLIRGRGYILNQGSHREVTGYILVKAAPEASLRRKVEEIIASNEAVVAHHYIAAKNYDYILHICSPINDHEVGQLIKDLRNIGTTETETLAVVGDDS